MGAVYFARSAGYTKIGYSGDPIARCSTITLAGTRPLDLPKGSEVEVIGWLPGNYWTEGSVHAQFIDRRVRGEWFRDVSLEEVREIIWADPRGVDVMQMSALAVFTMRKTPTLTRDMVSALGIPVLGVDTETAIRSLGRVLTVPTAGGAT